MFNIMDMMGKLKETQQKMEAVKNRLDTVYIDEKNSDGSIVVSVTASQNIKSIDISPELLGDKEQLEDYLILTLNKALSRAKQIQEQEIATVAKEGMPNIPGLF